MKRYDSAINGIFLSILAFFLFSSGDSAVKILSRNYDVLQITWMLSLASLPMLVAASPWLGGLKKSLVTKKWKMQSFRSLLCLVNGPLIFYGFSMMPMARVYTILFCAPFFASILSIPLLKQRVGINLWIAITLGFLGVLVALRPGTVSFDLALFSVVLGAATFSLINILVPFMGEDETPLSYTLYPCLFRCILMTPLMLPAVAMPSLQDALLFIFCGLCMSAGVVLISMAFRFAPAAVVSPFHYTQLIWGAFFGYFIFGEITDLWTAAGAAIIVASGLYIMREGSRDHAEVSELSPSATEPSILL